MSYYLPAYAHLVTIVPEFLVSTSLLLVFKRTARQKLLDRIYMILVLVTATITPFRSGPRLH